MSSAHPHGFLVIDKPSGITSRAAVDRAQTWFPPGTRLGHAGTLDPLATGVLVIGVGQGTRLIDYVQRMTKVYQAGVLLGATSATDDAEGPITPRPDAVLPESEVLRQALANFVGVIDQVPPAFSAAHVQGRRAYALARRGRPVELAARQVNVFAIEVLRVQLPRLELRIHCGKGTYIRSLARDLGQRLGCGAYLESLRRTRIGAFTVENAVSLEMTAVAAWQHVMPLRLAVADMQKVVLSEEVLIKVGQGKSVPWPEHVAPPEGEIAVLDETGNLRALASFRAPTRCIKADKVFPLVTSSPSRSP